MKHRIGFNRLARKASHRESLLRNMVTSLFKYERITTTKTKALAVRQNAEKMITRAKSDSVHNRRIVGRRIKDEAILAKLFTEIGPRYESRPGGYTRILKLGQRPGDASEMVILELVDRVIVEKKTSEKKGGEKRPAGDAKPVAAKPRKSDVRGDAKKSAAKSTGQTARKTKMV